MQPEVPEGYCYRDFGSFKICGRGSYPKTFLPPNPIAKGAALEDRGHYLMASEETAYTTKELSKKTWPDFVKLFSQGNGWDHCQCVHFHRPSALPKEKWLRTRAERAIRNRRENKQLVNSGRSHGILVYDNGEPVGWCQYGPKEELPRIDNGRNYRAHAPKAAAQKLWRITCFVVLKNHRKQGIATAALKAALLSIRKKGGGAIVSVGADHVASVGSLADVRWIAAAQPAPGFCIRIADRASFRCGLGGLSSQAVVGKGAGFTTLNHVREAVGRIVNVVCVR